MLIKHAEFVGSFPDVKKCPGGDLPEYAFTGRSNAGKSSIINYLTGRKKLAKTSSTPGKTLLINHFLIDNAWYLVDLPGYGYARASKKTREKIARMIDAYVKSRDNLVALMVILDVRLKPQPIDLDFIERLGINNVPFCLVFNKADKISSSVLKKQLHDYEKELLKTWEELPEIFITSATKGLGKEEILGFIAETNQRYRSGK
ncbi:MAG: ribosome biogenesis GTP-binding protein YihA/YsxC [Bacteroidales bacterium]